MARRGCKGSFQVDRRCGGQMKQLFFWLSIWDSFFKVTIFLPEKARADVLSLPLDNELS
jgi:hypothetical protein